MRVRFVTSLERGGPIEHTLGLAAAMHDSGIDVGAVCVSDEVADRFSAAGADAAARHAVTPAPVILRWHVEIGSVPRPNPHSSRPPESTSASA